MAWPNTLTEEEQNIVIEFDKSLRDAIKALVKGLNRCQDVYDWYWRQLGGGDNLIAKLDAGDVIPSQSGYAAITAFPKSEITENQMAYIEAALAINTEAHRDHYRLAIGGQNMTER